MSTLTKISVAQYDEMVAAGEFDGLDKPRVELIFGEVRELPAIGPRHALRLQYLTYWSVDNAPRDQVKARLQSPIHIVGLDSEPEPDLAWVKTKDYGDRHPSADDSVLVVEIADTTLDVDREEKGRLYATAGIPDYWIVNIRDTTVEVYRKPKDGRYEDVRTYRMGDIVRPLEFPDLELSVEDPFSYAA